MIKIFLECAGFYFTGWALGFVLSFGQIGAQVYFDSSAFVRLGAFFAVLFAVLNLYTNLFDKGGK